MGSDRVDEEEAVGVGLLVGVDPGVALEVEAAVGGELQLHVAEEEVVITVAVLDDHGARRAELGVHHERHVVRRRARLPVLALLAAPQRRLPAQLPLPRLCIYHPVSPLQACSLHKHKWKISQTNGINRHYLGLTVINLRAAEEAQCGGLAGRGQAEVVGDDHGAIDGDAVLGRGRAPVPQLRAERHLHGIWVDGLYLARSAGQAMADVTY